MSHVLFLMAAGLCGCRYVTYYHVTDYGGSATISLVPQEAGTGISLGATVAGLTLEELDQLFDGNHRGELAYFPWSTDSQTGAPVQGGLVVYVPSQSFTSDLPCDSPASFDLALDGAGGLWFDLDPVSNAAPGDQITINESDVGLGIQPSDNVSVTVPMYGSCLGSGPVLHDLTLDWTFPEHDERTERVRAEGGYVILR